MEIDEIKKQFETLESEMTNIKEVIEDYEACKNARLKKFLLAALNKFMTPFIAKTETANA